MSGIFAQWQPEYAARGLPTFPVNIKNGTKKPAVRNYLKIKLRGSVQLAKRYGDAVALGLACGPTTGLTVLDVDSSDERILADALIKHGKTPFVARTGSGNFQAWYRHNGEKRIIRPWGDRLPIDQLGGGYVVAPPSHGARNHYEIITGSLDDLLDLPAMQNAFAPGTDLIPGFVPVGKRNKSLFKHCLRAAHHCDTFEDLLDVAETFNEDACEQPLEQAEVMKTAESAWAIEERGDNRVGQHGAWLAAHTVEGMVSDPYLLALVNWLQSKNGPNRTFWVADGLTDVFGWPRRKFQEARREAVKQGWIVPLSKPAKGKPIEYRWGAARRQAG